MCWQLQSRAEDGEAHLDAEQQLLVRHLQPPRVVLQVPRPLQVLLHPLDVVHRSLQDRPFVPAHVPAVQDGKKQKQKKKTPKDCCLHPLPKTPLSKDLLPWGRARRGASPREPRVSQPRSRRGYLQVVGFGDQHPQLLDAVVDVEPSPPLNCRARKEGRGEEVGGSSSVRGEWGHCRAPMGPSGFGELRVKNQRGVRKAGS